MPYNKLMKLFKYILPLLIVLFVLLSSWQMVKGSIIFHTDIARDFLLMEDMLVSGKPTLIGPRSGGIPGVFHGPLWLFVNLPIFIISGGNPVATGWFWVFLFLVSLIVTFWVGKRMFSTETGLIAVLLVAASASESISSLFNPFGAVILSPLFFFFFVQYVDKQTVRDLLLCLFILGLIIQFQMAFGVPLLVLISFPLFYVMVKKRNFFHIFSFFILLLPLSTFILFDLRHDMLQAKSVFAYIGGTENMLKLKLHQILFLFMRIKEMLFNSVSMFVRGNFYASVVSIFILGVSFIKLIHNPKIKERNWFFYSFYLYIGYWVLTLLFKGTIWSYYYWPFLPLLAIMFTAMVLKTNKNLATYILLIGVVVLNLSASVKQIIAEEGNYIRSGSWLYYYNQAQKLFIDSGKEDFGYYIYTADQFGYSTRYAMNFTKKQFPEKKVFPYQKKKITYLVIFPSSNPYTSEHWWKKNQVKIDRKPDKTMKFKDGSYIEKYYLDESEQEVESDQNLIHSLIFR